MLEPNVLAFTPRRATGVSTPTINYDPLGWLEVTPEIYDWFIRNPDPATRVNAYGFLHQFTRRAFVCIARHDGGFVCGMSNWTFTDEAFDLLNKDDVIDHVIERLGYEPTTV